MNKYNGEEIRYKSFAVKDTAKERYSICIEIAASIPHKTLLSEEF
jgi:hypothetical protein